MKKLEEARSSLVSTNLVSRSYTSPPNLRVVDETKDKAPTQEMDGESCPNKKVRTTGNVDLVCRHPFIDAIIKVPLPDKWKGFKRDRYDDTHMSLYTADDAVMC